MRSCTVKRQHRAYDAAKRLLDVVFSAVLLVLLAPLMAVIGILVLLDLGSPVLFTQPRPGRDGKVFMLRKFRSMAEAPHGTDDVAAVGSDSARVTRLGRLLRATSLDELPQLWNVLVGDMSFVGPRPLLVAYLDRYDEEQSRRHEVRPGITGWAQVNGRNSVPWPERLAMDVWYVDNRSMLLDARIVMMTLGAIVMRDRKDASGNGFSEPFEPSAGSTGEAP